MQERHTENIKQTEPWPIAVAVETNRAIPRFVVSLVLVISSVLLYFSYLELIPLEPPPNPSYNQFFSVEEGRHLWVIVQEGRCEAVIAGGWKQNRVGVGESVKFSMISRQDGEVVNDYLKGLFSEYKLLKRLSGKVDNQAISFNGKDWTGITVSSREPMMLVEVEGGRRQLKLPASMARKLHPYIELLIGSNIGNSLQEVDLQEFQKCKRELESGRVT